MAWFEVKSKIDTLSSVSTLEKLSWIKTHLKVSSKSNPMYTDYKIKYKIYELNIQIVHIHSWTMNASPRLVLSVLCYKHTHLKTVWRNEVSFSNDSDILDRIQAFRSGYLQHRIIWCWCSSDSDEHQFRSWHPIVWACLNIWIQLYYDNHNMTSDQMN